MKIEADEGSLNEFLIGMLLYRSVALILAAPTSQFRGLPIVLRLHRLGTPRRRCLLVGGGLIEGVMTVLRQVRDRTR